MHLTQPGAAELTLATARFVLKTDKNGTGAAPSEISSSISF